MNFVSRFGVIGQKIGMTTIYDENKRATAVTLVKVPKQFVILKKELEEYSVLKIGVSEGFGKLKTKPQIEEFKKSDKPLCKVTKEFRVEKDEASSISDEFGFEALENEKFLDVTSKSVGKGFAGGMKRWNFSGGNASHGASLSHRAIGSTGTRDKNWPGKKMPGRLGHEVVTMQNIGVACYDPELSLVGLKGSVPGKKGTMVVLRKAIKKAGKREV